MGEMYKLMVNYIPNKLSQEDLQNMFSQIGPVASCKLVKNHDTGVSAGYGFVDYTDKDLADEAVRQLNGKELFGKTLRVAHAKSSEEMGENTNVYVAGLPTSIDENSLREMFSQYGEIVMTKLLRNNDQSSRGAGFVRFKIRGDAERAINVLHEALLPDSVVPLTVRLALPSKNKRESGGVRYNPMSGGRDSRGSSSTSNQLPSLKASSTISAPATSTVYSVYVYGLNPHHTELNLYELFSPYGAIQTVKLMRDNQKEDRPSKGFAFINFVKLEDATQAIIGVNGRQYDGKMLQVAFKTEKGTNNPSIVTNLVQNQPQLGQFAAPIQNSAALQQSQLLLAALQQQPTGVGYSTAGSLGGAGNLSTFTAANGLGALQQQQQQQAALSALQQQSSLGQFSSMQQPTSSSLAALQQNNVASLSSLSALQQQNAAALAALQQAGGAGGLAAYGLGQSAGAGQSPLTYSALGLGIL